MEEKKIKQIIFDAIDELNLQLPEGRQLEKSSDTALFGNTSGLDSLGLVKLIVAVEQRMEEECDQIITIADEKAVSMKNSPFRTVCTLTDYISHKIKG